MKRILSALLIGCLLVSSGGQYTAAQTVETATTTEAVKTTTEAKTEVTTEKKTEATTEKKTEATTAVKEPATTEAKKTATTEAKKQATTAVKKTVKEVDKKMGAGSQLISGKSGTGMSVMEVPAKPKKTLAVGVDISKWNWPPNRKNNIDFSKLSKDVDFVIIRCGFGSNNTKYDDKYFARSVEQCEKYKIPYGVYLYSYATSTTAAKSEAEHTIRLLKSVNAKLSLPVYYDMEDAEQGQLSRSTLGTIAKTYCDGVKKAGYDTGIYANTYWFNAKLTDPYFVNQTKWVAQYASACAYRGQYAIWQCTDRGKVAGIEGIVDLNYMVEDIFKKNKTPKVTAKSYSGTYDGKAHSITVQNHKTVKYSTDNKKSYSTNQNIKKLGKKTVYYKATGKDGKTYTGKSSVKISQRHVSKLSVASVGKQEHTGKKIAPKITVKNGTIKLAEGKDYTISYGKNTSIGDGTVKISTKGNYTGAKTVKFDIVPKKVTNVKCAKGIKVTTASSKWNKVSGITGYQVAYSRQGENDWNYAEVKSNSKEFDGLRVKKYDIKVRGYKTVNGSRKYGAFSTKTTMHAK